MSSDTTKALLQSANDRLLAYVDNAGRKLTDYIGLDSPRLFIRIAPDACTYPYVVIRIMQSDTDTDYSNLRAIVQIEALCVHRADDGNVELVADLVEDALLTWRESSDTLGITFGQSSTRESREPINDPINRDLAEVALTVTCGSWEKRLTAIAP